MRSFGYKARTLIKTQIVSLSAFLFGGDGGIRTLDLTDANRTLSQLSYAPMSYLLFVPDLHSEALGVPAELQAHI